MDLIDKRPDREFSFDHALWSHDGFSIRESDGYAYPNPGSQYCDQEQVWQFLGVKILENAWKGLNCTAFAYG